MVRTGENKAVKLDPKVEEWLEASYKSRKRRNAARKYFAAYLEFTGLTPQKVIEEKAEQRLERNAERRILAFRPWFEKNKGKTEFVSFDAIKFIRGFYSYYGQRLSFRRNELREPEAKSKDYPLTVYHLSQMVAAANVRGSALMLFAESTGMRVGDVVRMKRGLVEPLLANKLEDGIVEIGDLSTQKEHVKGHFFLHSSATQALEKYLQERTDDSPELFVTRVGKPLTRKVANQIIKAAFHRAGLEKGSLTIRFHCLRKLWTRAAQDSGITSELWKAMIGKSIGGEATYSSENYLEAFRKMLPKLDLKHLKNNHLMIQDLEQRVKDLHDELKAQREYYERRIMKLEKLKQLDLMKYFGEEITRLRKELAEKPSRFMKIRSEGPENIEIIALTRAIRRAFDEYSNENNHSQ